MDWNEITQNLAQFIPVLLFFTVTAFVYAYLYFTPSGEHLRKHLAETVFSNWRLALLGATGLVLSIASGWTTWDGMSNFTKEPVLSLMITFGVQGVMLIVAWLIGESFATGMHYRSSASSRERSVFSLEPVIGTIFGILLFVAAALLIINQTGVADEIAGEQRALNGSYLLPTGLLIAAVVILLSITLIMNSGSDIAGNYLQAMRIIIRSAVLWVMFLACMATSVFFSFDSLFSTIFPEDERARAAELRAQNQVAGVITDISELTARRRLEEQDRLFLTDEWKSYDAMLERLVATVRQAPKVLQDHFEEQVRENQRIVALRQEEKATAQSQQIRLKQRVKLLNEQIGRARE